MFGRRLKEPFHLMVGVRLKKRIQMNASAFFIGSDICKALSYVKQTRVHDKSNFLFREAEI